MMRIRIGLIALGILGTGLSAWQVLCTDDTPLAAGEKETAIVETSDRSTDAISREKPRSATNHSEKSAARESKSPANESLTPPAPRVSDDPISVRVLSTAAIEVYPFGVRQVVIQIPGNTIDDWHSDRLATVNCDQDRVFYEVFHPQHPPAVEQQEKEGSTITAYFLFQGANELDLDVVLGDQSV